MSKTWVKTPKHILRTACIDAITKTWPVGTFVEFGAGTGDLTQRFLARGYQGTCYDLGAENRQILRNNLAVFAQHVTVVEQIAELQGMQHDYLFAFEVLEHIVEDASNLAVWSQYLKPGGHILVSVPAHQRKFSAEDTWVGHIRRYEKQQLVSLLTGAGYTNIVVYNYGFPLGNITRIISRALHSLTTKRTPGEQCLTAEQRSIRSGIQRIHGLNWSGFLYNEFTLWPFIWLQRPFCAYDWGDGYVACGTKLQA